MWKRCACWTLALAALLPMACATSGSGFEVRAATLEVRVTELEQSNRRLQLRLDAYESSLALVEDQLNAFQAQQRANNNTNPQNLAVVRIAPPAPTPSQTVQAAATSWEQAYDRYDPSTAYLDDDEAYEDIVVSADKIQRYMGRNTITAAVAPSSSTPRTNTSATRVPHPDVVLGERLPSAKGAPTPAPAPAAASKTASATAPMEIYKEGMQAYRQNQFATAIDHFNAFLAANPPYEYIDNALYWLGECHYGQELYAEAAAYFHRIVQDYPDANKVPDALLKVALTYQRLNKSDSAQDVLHYLIEAFPNSEAATLARQRVESLNAS